MISSTCDTILEYNKKHKFPGTSFFLHADSKPVLVLTGTGVLNLVPLFLVVLYRYQTARGRTCIPRAVMRAVGHVFLPGFKEASYPGVHLGIRIHEKAGVLHQYL
jgi:hypothetical protein